MEDVLIVTLFRNISYIKNSVTTVKSLFQWRYVIRMCANYEFALQFLCLVNFSCFVKHYMPFL